MNSAKTVFFSSVFVILILLAFLFFRGSEKNKEAQPELVLHCAAGMRIPVSEIVDRYEDEYGVKVHTHYAGSGELAEMTLKET